MPSRYVGLAVAGAGAAATLLRLRSFAQLPRIVRRVERGGTVPPSEPSNARTALVVALLWAIDRHGVGRVLRAARLETVPSSIVSLLLAFGGLSLVEKTKGVAAAERVQTFFQPAVNFLGRWMMAVYTVSIVQLPINLGGFKSGREVLTVLALHAGLWLMSISSTALVVRLLTGSTAEPAAAAAPAPAATKSPAARTWDGPTPRDGPSQSERHRAAVRTVWTTLTAASFAVSPWLGEAPALFSTLLSSLLHAERLPVTMQQRGFHPIIIAGLVTAGATAGLGWARGSALSESFGRYLTTSRNPFSGPGDLLYEMMNPMTICLGFRMYASRRTIYANLKAILIGTGWAAATALLWSVAVARLCGVSPAISVVLGNRGISTPFAVEGAAALGVGANRSLTVAFVVISGIYGGAFGLPITRALGLQSGDTACGVTMGATGHGIATATLIQKGERNASALSSVGMIMTGVVHTLLCSAPAVRSLVRAMAGFRS